MLKKEDKELRLLIFLSIDFTVKFEIMLKVKALIDPQMRKIKLAREYLFPHVGLLRINSALK